MGSSCFPGLPFLPGYPILAPISLILGIFPVIFSIVSHVTTQLTCIAAGRLIPLERAFKTLVPALPTLIAIPSKILWLD